MKALLSLTLVGLVLNATSIKTFAGDREWATVGKVLTGVAAVQVIDRIINPPQPVVVYQQPVVVQQVPVVAAPVVVQPAPVVYVQPAPVVYYSTPQIIVYPGCAVPVYRYHGHHHFRR